MSENCKSLVLQDKCNIEIFLSPRKVVLETVFFLSEISLVYGAGVVIEQKL